MPWGTVLCYETRWLSEVGFEVGVSLHIAVPEKQKAGKLTGLLLLFYHLPNGSAA